MTLDGDKSHLRAFHQYPPHFTTGYHIFHDDLEPRSGTALLESTRMSHTAKGQKENPFGTFLHGKKKSMGGTSQPQEGGEGNQGAEDEQGTMGPDTYRTQPQPLSGTAYEFESGTFMSKSGLPPLNYKPYSTEYLEKFDDPKATKEMLSKLTEMYGTQNALHSTRPTLGGYPTQTLDTTLSRTADAGSSRAGSTSRVVAF
eukprot:CAMPEP_0202349782 /NCGR_PEP_ID=MMETSP1126-20121109/7127_1 /ASSEMBLY_ACC=CAM_ASM_000457 /TAXON_ID=3047 /ORGANISM="Dunaliella tertiolecta, Strain CCMP1320" /LENGTH=199 /DNA_ID=CAMNT_0048941643 /DNA_START=70 /DNA_END=669 /DNA_ORIENTATION=-